MMPGASTASSERWTSGVVPSRSQTSRDGSPRRVPGSAEVPGVPPSVHGADLSQRPDRVRRPAGADRSAGVSDDLYLVSFDDDDLAGYMRPPLTTARLPYYEMGRLAMKIALASDTWSGEHLVPMPLQVRDSVRALPRLVSTSG